MYSTTFGIKHKRTQNRVCADIGYEGKADGRFLTGKVSSAKTLQLCILTFKKKARSYFPESNHASKGSKKMKKAALLLVATICFLLAGLPAAHAGEHKCALYTGSTEFERMKQLVGVWEGTSDMGKEGEKVRVEYRLSAGGSALIETLFPGSDEEMISVYHDQKGKLAMTHYCMEGNQPRMTLGNADAQTIQLVFASEGNEIDPAKEKHMHAVRITFTDNDHIIQKWTLFDKGKDVGGVTLKLARVH